MGSRCAYAGTLGSDPASHFVAERLTAEGIDLRYLRLQRDVRPIQSTIVVTASGTRTVLYDLSGHREPASTGHRPKRFTTREFCLWTTSESRA